MNKRDELRRQRLKGHKIGSLEDGLRGALLNHTCCLLVWVGGNAVRSVAGFTTSVAVVPKLEIAATHEERPALAGPRRIVAFGRAASLPSVKKLNLDWTELELVIRLSFLFHVEWN